mmetsp:Transcript_16871/g.40325  ORF Transcript_16871/g.40325 Transcript_16871/m.40325 type:complete len:148 (-) Transcript_16871:144-587(-)
MSSGHVDHHEHRYQSFGRLGREDEEHEIDNHRTDELVDPLNSNRKLKQEGSEYEGEQMLHFSVWEGEHNQSQRIADEHPEQIFECFDILASRLSKRPDRIFHECRHENNCGGKKRLERVCKLDHFFNARAGSFRKNAFHGDMIGSPL